MSRVSSAVRRHAPRTVLNLTVLWLFLLHVLGIMPWPLLWQLEDFAYDTRLRMYPPEHSAAPLVIVDIDEKSLMEVGRWPWSRHLLAKLLDRLFEDYQANLVAFDMVFPEPDASSGLKVLERLLAENALGDPVGPAEIPPALRAELDYDARFVQALQDRRVVLGYGFLNQADLNEATLGKLPPPNYVLSDFEGMDLSYQFLDATGYVANLPEFTEAAKGSGHFTSQPDEDGVTRRIPLFHGYRDRLYEALSLRVARLYLNAVPEMEIVDSGTGYARIEAFYLQGRRIPVDRYLRTLIPFRGERGGFPYISASDVLQGRVNAQQLAPDSIVLIGTTATGLYDLRATPVGQVYPGVEVHANLIAGMLQNHLLENPPYMLGAEVLILLIIGLSLIILLPLLSPSWATIFTLGLTAGLLSFNIYLWREAHLVMPLASCLGLILALFLLNMSYGYFIEERGKRRTLKLFGHYVPPQLVDEISRNPELRLSLQGENREMTVLFSDVRDFTHLSEKLDPRQLTELMNHYLTPMTAIIHKHRGTIDKYMGDALMAFWGAPLADPEHARHALRAALEMPGVLAHLAPEFEARGWPRLRMGVGLHCGPMNVGNMGSEFRMAYTVMGDAVNLGSRLEGLTKHYGVSIIVSEAICRAVPEFAYRELDWVRVKGKESPGAIFEPLGLETELSPEILRELAEYREALKAYRQQDWSAAEQAFQALQAHDPRDRLYAVYVERVAYFKQQPPPGDWDGVFVHTSK